MSAITDTLSNEKGISAFIRNHPVIAYFCLAYARMWIAISLLVMDSLGLIKQTINQHSTPSRAELSKE
jgi:hypothetical protein